MGSDHEAEIRASMGAHHDLGPEYDDAVAEGLVERIGAEIDKRIEAQLRRYGPPPGVPWTPPGAAWTPPGAAWTPPGAAWTPPGVPWTPQPPEPAESAESAAPQGYPTPAGYLPGGYPGYPGYQAPIFAPGYQVQVPQARPTSRSAGQHSVAMTVIALGSMTLGVAATAIVAHAWNGGGGQAVMVLLIWAAIAIVNIAYARRC